MKLIDHGLEQLQKALYLCWNLEEGDKNYHHREQYAKEIGKQLLRAKKIKWYKRMELEKAERQMIMDQLLSELDMLEPNRNADQAPRVEGGGQLANGLSQLSRAQIEMKQAIIDKVESNFKSLNE